MGTGKRTASWSLALLLIGAAGCGADEKSCPDADRDGFQSDTCGGEDCDDHDETVRPGVPDNQAVGEWAIETVDSEGETGWFTSLAVDANGRSHVSYYDSTNDDLRYATNESGAWVRQTVDADGHTGWYTSLALDADGAVHIGYYEYVELFDGHLHYATNESGAWVPEMVDGWGDTGSHASLALDADGAAHIGYFDNTDADLRYATNESGEWVRETVDADGLAGLFVSLALDADGAAHISYESQVCVGRECHGVLHYATDRSGEWVLETVDAEGDTGLHTSLALDAAGAVHVGYFDETDLELHYATNRTGEWSTEMVDAEGRTGGTRSLAIDRDGAVHIGYESEVGDLRHATNQSGEWVLETVDAAEDVGRYASLALDAAGAVHVSYYDEPNGDLRYATNRIPPDGVDQNCDGVDGVDADGDGHASRLTGGDDCDDANPSVFEACD